MPSLAGAALLCTSSVFADSPRDAESTPGATFPLALPEVEASYRVVVNGIPVGLNATIRLTRDSEHYQLHFKAQNRLFRHEETALFDWSNCVAKPHHYQHESVGFGIQRGGEIDFDWDTQTAKGSKAVYPLARNALDALSVAMVSRCHMAKADQSFSFDVAEPDGMTKYQYRALDNETIKTPAGEWLASGLERDYEERGRKSRFWAAPSLEYFMIRMDHQENPFVRGRIELTEFRYLSDEDSRNPERQAGSTVSSR
ncbi:hypothetical protein Y5S_00960 [Alcanivorax nanhaiticus]|uniref:DUF3108 domain-containing protein n=2 Tax=Alcanivorax nanhaiticus TaxID=1177154 RepID=A0A095SM58_9GAMM|nr:hypothetical protein Y5S_00960 [Alcanivorax nanhaiticus]